MPRQTNTSIAIAIIAGLGLASCGLDDAGGFKPPPVQKPQISDNPNQPTTPADNGPLSPPVLDYGVPTTSCADSVALVGSTAPNATVIAIGGADPSGISTDADRNGRFCIPFRLRPGQLNQIEVHARDLTRVSQSVFHQMTHQMGCNGGTNSGFGGNSGGNSGANTPINSGFGNGSKNVASEGEVTAQLQQPKHGNPRSVIDGDPNTYVHYQTDTTSLSDSVWIAINLKKLVKLSKIVVTFKDQIGSGETFASQYKVMISQVASPGDPGLDTGGLWATVKDMQGAGGGRLEFSLHEKPMAQHVAILMEKDGSDWTWTEEYALAEVEVWDEPLKTAPTIPTDTNVCASASTSF